MTRQLVQEITYPVLDMTDDASSFHSVFHSPAKEASTYTFILLLLSGVKIIP